MKNTIKGKRRARRLALQALYQWLMSDSDLCEIEAQFHAVNNMSQVDVEYFHRLIHEIPQRISELQAAFIPWLDRSIDSLNPIELTILRLSSFELLHCPELPFRVILDESVSLAREFGAEEGHRYVNGVLNNLARQVRTLEISQPRE